MASNPQIPWSYPGVHSLASQTTLNLQYLSVGAPTCDTIRPTLPLQANVSTGSSIPIPHAQTAVGQSEGEHQQSVFNADGILPNVNSLRQNQSI